MIATALLLGLLAVATVTDVLWHRIPNSVTYSGILAALGLNGLGSLLVVVADLAPERLAVLGWIGLGQSLFGFFVCGFILLVCYVLLKVGGGDVKLIAMIGAILGPEQGVETMLWTFVLGGCMGLIVLVWKVGPWRLLSRMVRQLLYTIRIRQWSPLTEEERAQLQPPLFLAPSALAAALIVQFSLVDYF